MVWLQFQENEKKRYQAEQQRFELKHQRQLEELRAMSDATIKELEHLQNEKRKMLTEHETLKLKQREEAFAKELKEWKSQLKPRKQVRYNFLSDIRKYFFTKVIFHKITFAKKESILNFISIRSVL